MFVKPAEMDPLKKRIMSMMLVETMGKCSRVDTIGGATSATQSSRKEK